MPCTEECIVQHSFLMGAETGVASRLIQQVVAGFIVASVLSTSEWSDQFRVPGCSGVPVALCDFFFFSPPVSFVAGGRHDLECL